MFFYYAKKFESAQGGKSIVGIVCEQCHGTYYYELARIGTGTGSAHYGIGSKGASQHAEEKSQSDLADRLAMEAELVPCPHCHWISEELVKGYRLGRYRGISNFAFTIGLIGTIISLISAWFINLGPQRDHWLLPYLLIGGPALSIGMAMVLLGIRKWLRNRIRPNSQYPQEPTLPPGTPPALLLDEESQTLRPAKRESTSTNEYLDFQYARHALPDICCDCLEPGSVEQGYPIKVTQLVQVMLPRCVECATKASRHNRRIWLKTFMWGVPISAAIVFAMVLMSLQTWIIIDTALFLLAVILILAFIFKTFQIAPAKVVSRDEARGVVRLRFRNPGFISAVNQSLNAIDSED